MYETHYDFDKLPFENLPDPRFFYASEQHCEALAAIEYSIRLRKGVVLITGAIGSGKTTVGRTMLHRCGEQATIVQLAYGHQSGVALLQQVLRSLRVKFEEHEDHGRLIERLVAAAQRQAHQGRPVVLFVDEAQTLSDEAIEELRLMSNFDSANHKLLQLVMVGQPELRDRIGQPAFAALRQRIFMAKQLQPLGLTETAAYIRHRLAAASRDAKRVQADFEARAIEAIYEYTRGIPRLINVVCDNCLLMGFVRQTRTITANIVQQVLVDMVPSFDDQAGDTFAQTAELRLAGSM